MRSARWLLALGVLALRFAAAEACNPVDLYGPYGIQLSGTSTISGAPTPIAVIGRLDFASDGKVSGYSSVNFNGWFLGNPVTGTYQFKDDCSLTLNLQDDSGAFQHFRGAGHTGAQEFALHQTDPGSGARGVVKRIAHDGCGDIALRGGWLMSMRTTAMMDGSGGVKIVIGGKEVTGSYHVDSDCFVLFDYAEVHLRGIVVNGGKEVLAIYTDPQHVGVVNFTTLRPG